MAAWWPRGSRPLHRAEVALSTRWCWGFRESSSQAISAADLRGVGLGTQKNGSAVAFAGMGSWGESITFINTLPWLVLDPLTLGQLFLENEQRITLSLV